MKKYIVALPIIIFFVFLAITFIPNGFSLMGESNDPWYTPYTSIVFLFLAIFFYPATFIFELVGGKALGTGYHLMTFAYSIVLSFCINKGWEYFKSKNS